jgi:hypothetical protein
MTWFLCQVSPLGFFAKLFRKRKVQINSDYDTIILQALSAKVKKLPEKTGSGIR